MSVFPVEAPVGYSGPSRQDSMRRDRVMRDSVWGDSLRKVVYMR